MKSKSLSLRQKLTVLWVVMLVAVLVSTTACSSTPTDSVPASPNPVNSKPSATVTSPVPSVTVTAAVRVEVLYFHNNQRCVTCLCFEERVTHVVREHFKDELSAGILTYRVLNRQDKNNADLVKKYQPVGSQLFINTVVNGTDHIVDVQDIWAWNCRGKPDQFDDNIQKLIAKSLTGAI